jgi:large subunit ribosomal protein L7/L12
MPAASAAPAAASAAAAEAPVEEKPKEKTMFTVTLKAIDASAKAKIIREIKSLNSTMSLVEVCTVLDHAPAVR